MFKLGLLIKFIIMVGNPTLTKNKIILQYINKYKFYFTIF